MRRIGFVLLLVVWLGGSAKIGRAEDWPQWGGAHRDGVWRESGILDRFPEGGPKVLWRLPIGTGYSGPAVANGKVFVMDRERAKDAEGKPLRATRDGVPGNERVLCLDAATGKSIWTHAYDCPYRVSYASGPRTTPLVHQNRVYALGTMGDLLCIDQETGKVVWSKKLLKEYGLGSPPVWGFAAHPLIEGDLLYTLVGAPNAAVVALNKDTGAEVWRALQTQEVGYSPPMIYEAGGTRQLIIWLSESINSLDPATGKVHWTLPYPTRGDVQRPAVNIIQVQRLDDLLFISTFYHGPMVLKLAADKPAAEVLWQGKSDNPLKPDGLHSLMAAPIMKDGHIYGACANGELRCIDLKSRKQLWETYDATGGKKADCGTAFLIPNGNRYFIYNDSGELILADLSPQGYKELGKARVLEPNHTARGRIVVWSHPAFANRCFFARNDKEIICVSLAADTTS
jgi:outer membrane protein assembly factor BamB